MCGPQLELHPLPLYMCLLPLALSLSRVLFVWVLVTAYWKNESPFQSLVCQRTRAQLAATLAQGRRHYNEQVCGRETREKQSCALGREEELET